MKEKRRKKNMENFLIKDLGVLHCKLISFGIV